MKENIRTEAEKVLIEKGMNCAKLRNTFTLDGNDDSFLDRIINAMLDFHAQQLEKDNWVSEFDNAEFNPDSTVVYKGVAYSVLAVDFEERLILIDEFGDGIDNASWKRFENLTLNHPNTLTTWKYRF